MESEIVAKLLRGLMWLLSGLRGLRNNRDDVVLEAMGNLGALADSLEATDVLSG